MSQSGIPYFFMRGGTSRGPYFKRDDLPKDEATLSAVLIAVVGSGHPLNIDGIGGGNAVTTKVAMLSRSDDDWADVDYFFAQVSVEDRLVDYKPSCGNIMIGVGPAALEMGLVTTSGDETEIRIRAVNTGARVIAKVQTPGGEINYEGDAEIAGVPGTAAPIELEFADVAGSLTSGLLPTGKPLDSVDDVEVSCVDFAMPMVIARAEDFGLTGHESREELDADKSFFSRMEQVRIKAGELMGLGDCTKSVTPKFGLVAKPEKGGTLAVRYFMPWSTHPTLAVTGSQCLSACIQIPGTVTDALLPVPDQQETTYMLEHPMGLMAVVLKADRQNDELIPVSAKVVRTARKLAEGKVYIPSSIW